MTPLRIGIIGCGKIAQVRHIPEYAANPNAQLVGFFDLSKDRATQVAAPFGGRVFDSYQDLLADPDIDAVSVCTANVTHAEIVIAALKAGKHVLAEKPMAATLEECEHIASVAAASNKLLMFDHNQRFTKAHRMAAEMVASGVIGPLVSFRTTFGHGGPETWSVDPGPNTWFFNPAMTTMGAIGDLGVHKTDVVHFLTGERVVEVTAKLATLEKRDTSGNLVPVDDHAIAVYTLSNGAVGTMTASWCFHGAEDNSTVLFGRDGILRIYDDPDYQLIIDKPGQSPEKHSVEPMQTSDLPQASSGVIDAFVDAVLNGLPSPMPADEALAAMRAVFAAMESSRTGQSVAIPENASRGNASSTR